VCPGCGGPRRHAGLFEGCPGYPYVGPLPAPSQNASVALLCTAGGLALLALAQAALEMQRAELDRRGANGAITTSAIHHNAVAVDLLAIITVAGVVTFLVLYILWRRQRRPIDTLARWGEACVETPSAQVNPRILPVGVMASVVAAAVGAIRGVVPAGTPLASFDTYRLWSAGGRVALAIAWLLVVAMVVHASRQLDRRVRRSEGLRSDPAAVGYIPTQVPRDRRRVGAPYSIEASSPPNPAAVGSPWKGGSPDGPRSTGVDQPGAPPPP
jgi:hypothetical protein